MLLSFQTGFNLVNAAVVCAFLESISGLEPKSDTTEPRCLKLVIVPSFCPFTLVSLLMPLLLFAMNLVFSALISMPKAVEVFSRRSTTFARSTSPASLSRVGMPSYCCFYLEFLQFTHSYPQQCQIYRTISLISHPSEAMPQVILNRLKAKADELLAEEQLGFRPSQSTVDQIFNSRVIIEKHLQHQRDLFHNFIDFKKAFRRIWQAGPWQVRRSFNIDEDLVQAIQAVYENSSSAAS